MKLAIQHSEKKWLNHYLPLDFFSSGGRTGKYCVTVLLSVVIAILGDFKMGFHVRGGSRGGVMGVATPPLGKIF